MFIFDKDRLEEIALENSKIFRDNQPFPHLIIDNFLSKKEAEIISDKFPKPGDIAWSTHGSGANSDKENKVIMRYTLEGNYITDSEIFFDANHLESPGVPDGLKVDYFGNVFATGPGGVLVLSPEGDHLGTIRTGEITANVAWGQPKGDHRCSSNTLIMTASTSVYRCELLTRGCVP